LETILLLSTWEKDQVLWQSNLFVYEFYLQQVCNMYVEWAAIYMQYQLLSHQRLMPIFWAKTQSVVTEEWIVHLLTYMYVYCVHFRVWCKLSKARRRQVVQNKFLIILHIFSLRNHVRHIGYLEHSPDPYKCITRMIPCSQVYSVYLGVPAAIWFALKITNSMALQYVS
jgi:hypothetical protein